MTIQAGMTIGYFSQDVGEMSGKSAVAAVMDGVGPVSELATEIARPEAPLPASASASILCRVSVHALPAAKQNPRG